MVKVTYCDRCKKEIKRKDRDSFGEVFDDEDWDDKFNFSNSFSGLNKAEKYHLCDGCKRGYNKIINKTNKELKKFIKKDN
ncbi:MAG: hypothetical protein WDZ77_01965 [Candidatus Pacearchaeota archaeon]